MLALNLQQTDNPQTVVVARWYFGGLGSAFATLFTHPLDLIKVTLQTQQERVPVAQIIRSILHQQGILAFYSGLSASLLRQLTYSVTRFGIYEAGKSYSSSETFAGKLILAGISGTLGGIIGI